MREGGGHGQCFCGNGDLTKNAKNCKSAILFYPVSRNYSINHFAGDDGKCNCSEPDLGRNLTDQEKSTGDVLYFEYTHQKHIQELLAHAKQDQAGVQQQVNWTLTRSATYVQNITCNISDNDIGVEVFSRSLLVMRSIQVENVLSTTVLHGDGGRFDKFNVTDVLKAVWSHKAAEDVNSNEKDDMNKSDTKNMNMTDTEYYKCRDNSTVISGWYRVYKQCGRFEPKYAASTAAFTLAIFVVWLFSVLSLRNARGHGNAQMLASTAFERNDREDMSSGIPLHPIGTSDAANVDGTPRYRRKLWSRNPETIRINVDTEHNRGSIHVSAPGQVRVDDVFQS